MHLPWDKYSDQPAVIKDRALKKRIYKKYRWDFIKMLATNLIIYPISWLFFLARPPKVISPNTSRFFGISINLDKNPQETKGLIEDLKVNEILIRVPLHDIENLQSYVDFASDYSDKNLLINILQDRRHVENPQLLKQSLKQIFTRFLPLSNRFQIANAINRKKWAIFSMDEYLSFYQVAYDLKQQFPSLVLIGPPVIDFEYYFTIRTLFNFSRIKFDECSSLLYVDRRGAPENTQMGLNLTKKLHFLHAILRLSPKSKAEIVITEINWPITKTAPYAPTSENDCVSLEDHASFLVRYYLLALATGVVKNVYWHQLIAPGYGLIDNRDNKLVKYPAYQAFKVMLAQLQGAEFMGLKEESGLYVVTFKQCENLIEVLWSLDSTMINVDNKTVLSRDGCEIKSAGKLKIGASPVYLLDESKGLVQE